jgi:hypothetical protein
MLSQENERCKSVSFVANAAKNNGDVVEVGTEHTADDWISVPTETVLQSLCDAIERIRVFFGDRPRR